MTLAVLVARMGSSRLPGKAMKPVLGKPMVERMVERIGCAKTVDRIVIATTHLPEDDVLALLADRLGVDCFRGASEDVLGRIQGAVQRTQAGLIVELLGDNPLVHGALIDDVVGFHRGGDFDYSASVTTEYPHAPSTLRKFPIGIRVQVYTPATLERCAAQAKTPEDREHSTSFIARHPDRFKIGYFEAAGTWAALNRPEFSFAVNYPENLKLVRRIFRVCHPKDPLFTLSLALEVFDSAPSLRALMGRPAEPMESALCPPR